jgi:hypothetical protein
MRSLAPLAAADSRIAFPKYSLRPRLTPKASAALRQQKSPPVAWAETRNGRLIRRMFEATEGNPAKAMLSMIQ